MHLRASFMFLLMFASFGTVVRAQERPLAQKLLHVGEDTAAVATSDGTIVLADTSHMERIDTTAVDYVAPDAGEPGSERGLPHDRPARKRSAMRIGIGIGVGLFSGIWISL